MNCECSIPVSFPGCDTNIDLDYCGVEIPVSNVIFVDELPQVGDRDQLYIVHQSIYRWDNNDLKFIPVAGEDFLVAYFTDPYRTIIFDGGGADVVLATLDETILL